MFDICMKQKSLNLIRAVCLWIWYMQFMQITRSLRALWTSSSSWRTFGPLDLQISFRFPDIAIWSWPRFLLWSTRTEELRFLVVGWNQRNVQMCTLLIYLVHISGTLIYLVQRTMRSKVGPGLRIYTEEGASPPPGFLPTKLVRRVEHDTELMNRGWEIRIGSISRLGQESTLRRKQDCSVWEIQDWKLRNTKLKVQVKRFEKKCGISPSIGLESVPKLEFYKMVSKKN